MEEVPSRHPRQVSLELDGEVRGNAGFASQTRQVLERPEAPRRPESAARRPESAPRRPMSVKAGLSPGVLRVDRVPLTKLPVWYICLSHSQMLAIYRCPVVSLRCFIMADDMKAFSR